MKRLVTIYKVSEDPKKPGSFVLASTEALRTTDRRGGIKYVLQDGARSEFFIRQSLSAYDGAKETPAEAMKYYRVHLASRIAVATRDYNEAKRKLDAFEEWNPLRVVRVLE